MNFKIVRTNRKTLCVSISENNEIVVRSPISVTDERIKEFVESKMEWIEKIVAKNNFRLSENFDILNYEKIYLGGEKLPLIFANKNLITNDAVYIKNIKKIKQVFIAEFSKDFIEYANDFANTYKFRVSEFQIRSYKRRWGCCNKSGTITFNYLLFMLPPSVQRYVIIHELCHTVYFNHSADFWKLVSHFEPDYKKLRQQLKNFDFIIDLY